MNLERKLHYCAPHLSKEEQSHYQAAASYCQEFDTGNLWISNDEYANRVNYCPFCGYKAAKQMESK